MSLQLQILVNVVYMFLTESMVLDLRGPSEAGIFREPFTLTCYTPKNFASGLGWRHLTNDVSLAIMSGIYSNGSCIFDIIPVNGYTFTCDPSNGVFNMTISETLMTNSLNNNAFRCEDVLFLSKSNIYILIINIPVSTVRLASIPTDSNPVEVNESAKQQFTCTTNQIRPAAVINWFFGTENITSLGTITNVDVEGNLIVSTGNMTYTGQRKDSGKTLHCTAVNIGNRTTIKSELKMLQINYGPGEVKLVPSTIFYTVNETEDSIGPITCRADCNPNCTITWYGPNLPANTSVLNLQKIARNQSGEYQCTASNVVSSLKSAVVRIAVQYGPVEVRLFPSTMSYTVNETVGSIGPITCTADCIPKCTMTWSGPDIPVGTTDVLHLENINRNHSGNYRCIAGNIISSLPSMSVRVIVYYGPGKINIVPEIYSYTVNETVDSVGPIICTADCNPNCTITWSGPNLTVTSSVLTLKKIIRNQTGEYQCIATNDVSSSKSTMVRVNVQYGPGEVTVCPTTTSYTINETESIDHITCTADCKPNCTLRWSGPFIPVGTVNILSLQNLNRSQSGNFQCTASNIISSNQSVNIYVNVQYGPEKIYISSTQSYIVNETENSVGPITCAADCNPTCSISWFGPNLHTAVASVLDLNNITRNQSGNYGCNASNIITGLQSTIFSIAVQYKPEIISSLKNVTVQENETAVLKCKIDSLPVSKTEWIYNNMLIENKGVFYIGQLTKDTNIHISELTINRAECLTMGKYSCKASNILGYDFSIVDLIVTCEPRANLIEFNISTTIPITENASINLTIDIIAYPAPHIYWIFLKANDNTSVNVSSSASNRFGINRHMSHLFIETPNDNSFGQYKVYAYNVAERVHLIHAFDVIPERKPDTPGNVSCEGKLNYVYVFWISGFNGGRQQTFIVYYSEYIKDTASSFDVYDAIFQDPGQGKYQSAKIHPLRPGKDYAFKVIARNIISNTESEEVVCKTNAESAQNEMTDNPAVIGSALGVTAVVVVSMIVGIVIFLIKRRKIAGIKKEAKREDRQNIEDDGGLIDNILYESAGPKMKLQTESTVEYAVVLKEDRNLQFTVDKTQQETSLYSAVQKNPKETQKGANVSDPKRFKRKDNGRKHEKEDVYENTEIELGKEHLANIQKDNRNKDGLQYAELVFSPSPNGVKFIIHGLDDRIIYADVDTTLKIDILPESDEEYDTKHVQSYTKEADEYME